MSTEGHVSDCLSLQCLRPIRQLTPITNFLITMEIPQLLQAKRLFLAIGQLHVPSCGLGGVRPSGAGINTVISLALNFTGWEKKVGIARQNRPS